MARYKVTRTICEEYDVDAESKDEASEIVLNAPYGDGKVWSTDIEVAELEDDEGKPLDKNHKDYADSMTIFGEPRSRHTYNLLVVRKYITEDGQEGAEQTEVEVVDWSLELAIEATEVNVERLDGLYRKGHTVNVKVERKPVHPATDYKPIDFD